MYRENHTYMFFRLLNIRIITVIGIFLLGFVNIGFSDLQVEPSSETNNYRTQTIDSCCPGMITKDWQSEPPLELFNYLWPYRKFTYEILAPSRQTLSKMIYGLAIFVGDIHSDMPISRFERGAMGFHYSTEQVVKWANAIQSGSYIFKAPTEILFINRLVEDQIIILKDNYWHSTDKVTHIIGASPGNKRKIDINLTHEMIHVYLDENTEFKKQIYDQWHSLSSIEKSDFKNSLKGYNISLEDQVIKEWGVRKYEKSPPWKE